MSWFVSLGEWSDSTLRGMEPRWTCSRTVTPRCIRGQRQGMESAEAEKRWPTVCDQVASGRGSRTGRGSSRVEGRESVQDSRLSEWQPSPRFDGG